MDLIITSVLSGVVGSLFRISISKATELFNAHRFILFLLPIIGLIIVYIYKSLGVEGLNTNTIIDNVNKNKEFSSKLGIAIFVSTILTHFGGGSAGREGAAIQLGGSLGSRFKNTLPGVAGVFSALFSAPLTASIFAVEFSHTGKPNFSELPKTLFSAYTAFFISKLFRLESERYHISYNFDIRMYFLIPLFIILTILFCKSLEYGGKLFHMIRNRYIRILIGSIIIIVFTLIEGSFDYNGSGTKIIERAINGDAETYAFLFKLLLTTITIGSGFKGGEIVPSFFVGATFGCIIAKFFNLDPSFAASLGLVTIFSGVTNCPLAGLLLSFELFGFKFMWAMAPVILINFYFTRKNSLYTSQIK